MRAWSHWLGGTLVVVGVIAGTASPLPAAAPPTRPTTTGGNPIAAFSATISAPRPGKRAIAIAAPIGKPIAAEKTVAVRLTASDSATIAVSRGSRCASIAIARPKLCEIVSIRNRQCSFWL